jgi:hypothetical protein
VSTTATGVIGCAFYAFGSWQPQQQLIHVQLAASWDEGATFPRFVTVTDSPWDPLVNAPFSHGDPAVHFHRRILRPGRGRRGLRPAPDRHQDRGAGALQRRRPDQAIRCPHIPEVARQILVGVTQDGGGLVLVGGKLHRVPPRSPLVALLEDLASHGELGTSEVNVLRGALERMDRPSDVG